MLFPSQLLNSYHNSQGCVTTSAFNVSFCSSERFEERSGSAFGTMASNPFSMNIFTKFVLFVRDFFISSATIVQFMNTSIKKEHDIGLSA